MRLQSLFPLEQTREYQSLAAQSDAGTLTDADRERFLTLIELRDHQSAERLEIVAALSLLRGIPLREMMATLGIRPE